MAHVIRNTDEALKGLKKLLGRCQPDYRGNLGPKTEPKTQQTVTAALQAKQKQNVTLDTFRPYAKPKGAYWIAADATHTGKYHAPAKSADAAAEESEITKRHQEALADVTRPLNNPYKQQLDKKSGRPLVATVLTWPQERDAAAARADVERPKLRIFSKKFETSEVAGKSSHNAFFDAANVRAVSKDLEALTPRHRTALIRQICLNNPKFTAETKLDRPRHHWDPMTQLLAHAYAEPPEPQATLSSRKARRSHSATPANGNPSTVEEPGQARRNNIRMVALMRSTSAAKQRAWH